VLAQWIAVASLGCFLIFGVVVLYFFVLNRPGKNKGRMVVQVLDSEDVEKREGDVTFVPLQRVN